MSPGSSTESYPAFARIGLRENPGKNLNQVTCPDRDSNPGHLVSQPDALTVTPQSLVYETPIELEEESVARVLAAADALQHTPGVFERVLQAMTRRCRVCMDAEGRTFEQFLYMFTN
ncbi:hypothetical protein ANN_21056 [Periplaneta americana]|uniref:Uncharacterized protein n=1 Tax=Periplaneta americana TaxID=6978 RepID=A0ABQ8SFG3_PERAM|nr:hypothetical protein ANN_21056 [Periplaneta americana]